MRSAPRLSDPFLSVSGLGATATLAALLAVGASQATTAPAPEPYTMVEIAPGDYVRPGACAEATAQNLDGIANIGFVVGNDQVAVIDPGGSLADGQRLRASIRAATPLPIRTVIMTHAHPDHVFGAAAFLADHPLFIGHARLPASLAARGDYDRKRLAAVLGEAATGSPIPPTALVRTEQTIDLGGRLLLLQAQATAHTDTDLVVLDRGTGTLWAGDLLFVGRVPALDGSITGWLATLKAIEALPATRAVPGHGPASVAWPAGAADETRYLETLQRDVRTAIAHGQDIDEATAKAGGAERHNWALFDDYNGRNVTVAYKELQWE